MPSYQDYIHDPQNKRLRCPNKVINVYRKFRGARRKNKSISKIQRCEEKLLGAGVRIFDSMREVLKLHHESGSDGSEPSFRHTGKFIEGVFM